MLVEYFDKPVWFHEGFHARYVDIWRETIVYGRVHSGVGFGLSHKIFGLLSLVVWVRLSVASREGFPEDNEKPI